MKIEKAHCFFEQSGTFKNEFKNLGIESFDYDILDDFGQTDYRINLFQEIEKAYADGISIFDKISKNDLIIAFFPCIRFEQQILLSFKGKSGGFSNWTLEQKLKKDMQLHDELASFYKLITKLVLICLSRGLRLIIENPYSAQHYLTRYWALDPAVIDKDRHKKGDYFIKPTQYWFVNCEPNKDPLFEAPTIRRKIKRVLEEKKVGRSMISPEYANRFIREYILDH